MIVSNTKFSKKQKKSTTADTTKLGRHTENVWEPITKPVRKHRYRLPRAYDSIRAMFELNIVPNVFETYSRKQGRNEFRQIKIESPLQSLTEGDNCSDVTSGL